MYFYIYSKKCLYIKNIEFLYLFEKICIYIKTQCFYIYSKKSVFNIKLINPSLKMINKSIQYFQV